jgi:membrane protein
MDPDRARVLARLHDRVWQVRLHDLPPWRARLLSAVRLILALLRDLIFGQLKLRAMSLVYTTLLSLVPILALSFSVLKAFGVHNELKPALRHFLAPLGSRGDEITQRVIVFIDNINVGVLGTVGLVLLLYTALSLVHKVEESFNYIWHVTHPRTLGQRLGSYLSVLTIGPILMLGAIALTVAASSLTLVQALLEVETLSRIALFLGEVTPYLLVIGAFTVTYASIPSTSVRIGPALAGGLVGGVLWQSAGWAFATFVANSTKYAAIYSGFAVVILFMLWLYVSWLILLLGASVSFYSQHPEYLVSAGGEPRLSNRMRERLALLIMSRVAGSYVGGKPAWSRERLTEALGVPMHTVDAVVDSLSSGGLLAATSDTPPCYLPARELAHIGIKELLDVVRAEGEDRFLRPEQLPVPPEVDEVLQRLERARSSAVGEISVAQLIAADGGQGSESTFGLRLT